MVSWGAMVVCSLVMMSVVKPTGEMLKLVDRLQELLALPVTSYLRTNLYILCTVAFYALPALLAMATVRRLWRKPMLFVVTLSLAAIMLGLAGEIPVPLRPGNTWSLVEVGGSRGLINGVLPPLDETTIEIVLRGAGLLAFGLALMSLAWPDSARARTASAWPPVFRQLPDAATTLSMSPRMVFAAFCCVYAVVNVILYGIVGGFLTYPLMALIGDVRMVRSSVGAYLTLPAIAGLIGIPCVYLASVGALTRATRAASSPRWVSATPAILAAACHRHIPGASGGGLRQAHRRQTCFEALVVPPGKSRVQFCRGARRARGEQRHAVSSRNQPLR